MNALTSILIRLGLLKEDLDYRLLRASMVFIFLAFGYQKWFEYEAQVLIPYISNGPLIFWMYAVFGIRGATWFLGIAEWLFGALLFLGFWNKKLGILGALGSCVTFLSTVTIIPFMPNGWDPAAGFPAMAGNVPFLVKDVVLLAVSFYLLKQDVMRASLSARKAADTRTAAAGVAGASLTAPKPVGTPGAGLGWPQVASHAVVGIFIVKNSRETMPIVFCNRRFALVMLACTDLPVHLIRLITPGAGFGVQQKPGAVSRPGGSRSFGEYSLLEDSRYTSQEN